jgi:asparagine N-glycosylation enzyme membrane subunit Stt3
MDLTPYANLSFETRRGHAGFRIGGSDILILCAGVALTVTASIYSHNVYVGVLVGLSVWVYFLFCNVFRVRPTLEFRYAGIALVSAALIIFTQAFVFESGDIDRMMIWCLLVHIPAALATIAINFCLKGYHGLFWEKINPKLDDYIPKAVIKYEEAMKRRDTI